MADKILIKATKGDNEPSKVLDDNELGFHTREQALYIGLGRKNIRLCGAGDKEELGGKLTATPVPVQESLSADAGLSDVVVAFNNLISAMTECGIMKEQE